MIFKRSFSLFTIIASFLLVPNVFAGYQLGGDMKEKVKEKRVDLTIKDFKYPMLFNNNIYDFVTVAIYGTAAPGSGVIIAQKGDNYYVLTANHVVGEILKGDEIEIQTLDREYHSAELIQSSNKVDGALLKFNSKNKYYPAFIDSRVEPETGMYILTEGYALASKEAKKGSLRRSTGPIITVIDENTDGYDVLYDAATNVGMSGGGIFTDYGQTTIDQGEGWKSCNAFSIPILVGIHGRAESYRAGGKSGASMGVSVHTLLREFGGTLAKEGVTSLPDELDTLIYKDGCPIYKELRNNN